MQQPLLQRRLVHNDFDIVAAHRRRADDAHYFFAGCAVEHQHEGIDDRIERHDVAHVVIVIDGRRLVADREHAPLLAHFHRHRPGSD